MRMTTLSKISLAVGLLLMAGINWTAYSKAAGPATLEGDVSTAIVIELDDGIEDDTEDWALEFIVWQTPDDDPEQVGVTELEGLWVVESFVREGVDEPRVVGKHWQFVGGTFSIRFGATILSSGDVDVAGDFSMDISAMPTQIDINSSTHTNMVEVEGIYELDDDLLTICFYPTQGEMRRARPDRFESTDEIRTWLWKMRRVTEED